MNNTIEHFGQLFMVAIQGESVTVPERLLIREMQPAGFTLFARNLRSIDQIAHLVGELQSLFEEHVPIISIDQEGGEKERLPSPCTHWPGNYVLGGLRENAQSYTRQQYAALCTELRLLGFNTVFAPVLDVVDDANRTFIGKRAFRGGPQKVAELGVAAIEGCADAELVACAKHYPGHGATHVDSHLDLPSIERQRQSLFHNDLVPFRAAIESGCPMVMTAHIVYPDIDPERPATLSKLFLDDILRQELGFKGLTVTDDLNMMAISSRFERGDAAWQCLSAGNDLLLYCDSVDTPYQVYGAMQKALADNQGELSVDAIRKRVERVLEWKRQRLKSHPADVQSARRGCGSADHAQLAREIMEAAQAE